MIVIAVVFAALAVSLAVSAGRTRGAILRLHADAPTRHRGRLPGISLIAAATLTLLLVAGTRPQLLLVGAVGIAVTTFIVHSVRRERARRATIGTRSRMIDVCDAVAGELSCGQPPAVALAHAAQDWPELAPAASAARLGADVPGALRQLAERPGAGALRQMGVAWAVAQRSGAGLADVLDRLSVVLREDEETRRETEAALAPPRATARLLAVLPAFGLGLGVSLGGDPIGWLVGTVSGALCLAAGAALAMLGVAWVDRLSSRAEA
ncbi:MAG: type II secretion system F family protein [Nocardioidaceae bacterium]